MEKYEAALAYLYRELKAAKVALGRAEGKPGVTADELERLQRKIEALDSLIPLAIKADDGAGKEQHDPTKCRYYTGYSFGQVGGGFCVGTMEIDPCNGEGCDRWMQKEDDDG